MNISDRSFAVLLVLPTLAAIFGFFAYPLAHSLWLSVYEIDFTRPGLGGVFVGLKYWTFLFTDSRFVDSIYSTFSYSLGIITLGILASLGLALVLNEEFRLRKIIRVVLLIPWAMPATVTGILWRWIYNSEFGALNSILWQLGLISEYQVWLSRPATAMVCVIAASLWSIIPFTTLLLLASLQTVPEVLFDAAKIDGANALARFRNVTFPTIKDSFIVALVLLSLRALKTFDIIFVLTEGDFKTEVLNLYAYRQGLDYLRFSYGSVLAWVLCLITTIFTILYINKVSD